MKKVKNKRAVIVEVSSAPAEPPLWWSPLEAANRWRVSRTTVTRMLERGHLLGKKIGGQWRIHMTTIEAFEADGIPKPEPVRRAAVLETVENFI